MAHFAKRSIKGSPNIMYGYNHDARLQVLAVGQTTEFILIEGEFDDLSVEVEQNSVTVYCDVQITHPTNWNESLPGPVFPHLNFTNWEETQKRRLVTITGNAASGATQLSLVAKKSLNGNLVPFTESIGLVILPAEMQEFRQVNNETGSDFFKDVILKPLDIYEGACAVARDQLYSQFAFSVDNKKTKNTDGTINRGIPVYNKYTPNKKDEWEDWCGDFVYWCYQRASELSGLDTPFKDFNSKIKESQKSPSLILGASSLQSTPKTVYWGIVAANQNLFKDKIRLLYPKALIDPIGGTGQPCAATDPDQIAKLIQPGDICLHRGAANAKRDPWTSWHHTDIVVYTDGKGGFATIDGNQGGAGGSQNPIREWGFNKEELGLVSRTLYSLEEIKNGKAKGGRNIYETTYITPSGDKKSSADFVPKYAFIHFTRGNEIPATQERIEINVHKSGAISFG